MSFSLVSYEFLPHVRVYTEVFPDILEMQSILFEHEKTTTENPEAPHLFEPYRPWYTFGRVTDVQRTPDDCSHEYIQRQLHFRDRVKEVREAVIDDYCKIYGVLETVNSETWIQSSVNLAEYFGDASVQPYDLESKNAKPKAMNYHTDFEIKKMCEDSDNFLLTCNIYWNDDYEGGEIVFYHAGKLFPYKPKQGEVVIFPSGSPYFPVGGDGYYHCANTVFENRKYFSRNYLQYKHLPTTEMRDAIDDHPRGDRNPGDHHYSSLYNQMFVKGDEQSYEFLVHPIVKKFYEKLNSAESVKEFDKESLA
jgi:hypothetical protein